MTSTALLDAARGGDEAAYQRLIEQHRGELHAHCYRMLGSVQDAEDALQEAMLRAWRFLPRFDGRSSLRTWLYKIATNAALDAIGRRERRELPVDLGPPSDPEDGPAMPLVEAVWVEPYPTGAVEDVEQRESLELAFIAAVQHLPATQRAVLILREVLGFSAKEAAETLDTSVASVNSALQRARRQIDEKLPERTQQATLRELGDDGVRELVERYIDAMGRNDVDAVVAMLAEDAAWSMPPASTWYFGERLRRFLEVGPLSGAWDWRHLPAQANGQPAIGVYSWDEASQCHLPFALDVLTLEGDRIKEVTAFITRRRDLPDADAYARWPAQPEDEAMVRIVFEAVGLPRRVT